MNQQNSRLIGRLEAGDLSLPENQIPAAVMMMGLTKSGKTTTSYYFAGKPLTGIKIQGDIKFKVGGKQVDNAKIGFSAKSQTEIPNHFQGVLSGSDKISLFDCPGFLDTQGCLRMISNAYFNYRLFSKIPKIKFILVVKKSDLNDPATDFTKAVKGFFDNFKDLDKIKKQIFAATVLVVTRVESNVEEVAQRIKYLNGLDGYLNGKIPEKYHELFHQFIDHLLIKKKIFIIQQAKETTTLQSDKKNNLFGQIFKICQFWQRNVDDKGQVNMANINFQVGKDIEAQRYNEEDWNKYQSLLNYIKIRFKQSIDCYMGLVFKRYVNKIMQTNQDKELMKSMKEFNNKFYKFQEQREEKRKQFRRIKFQGEDPNNNSIEKKYSVYWIRKMKICQNLFHNIYSPISDQIPNVLNYQWIDDVEKRIVQLLRKMYILFSKKQRNDYSKFAYCIFRQLEETKALFLLLRSENSVNQGGQQPSTSNTSGGLFEVHVVIQNSISSLFEHKFDTIRTQFVSQYIVEQNQKPQQYKQVLEFFDQSQYLMKTMNKEQKDKFMQNKIRLSIYSSEFYLKLESKSQKLKAIKSLDQSRIILQKELNAAYANCEECKDKIFLFYQIMNLMGQFFNSLQQFKLAIICYDSINNVSQVLSSYNKWIQDNTKKLLNVHKVQIINQNQVTKAAEMQKIAMMNEKRQKMQLKSKLYQIYSQYGLYCFSHSQPELGMRQLQNAYQYASDYDELDKISSYIYRARVDSINYLQNMADKVFYKELNSDQAGQIYNMYGEQIQRHKQSLININSQVYGT